MTERRAGILVPLFSIPSSRSWGIGEIGDLESMASWLAAAGQRLLQLLPINEMPSRETSPYSALSAMAIDPLFITMDQVEDFIETGGEVALNAAIRSRLDGVRKTTRIRYAEIRQLKRAALSSCFRRFVEVEWRQGSERSAAFKRYVAEQAWWLDDYALFRSLHAQHGGRPWMQWPASLRDRDAGTLARARAELAEDILYRQYVQWLADTQWKEARRRVEGVALFGDLPFMVAIDSVDVWTHRDEFRLDVSVGVPPDAFSTEGQDWGLPLYRWDVLAERDFDWLRDRARRNSELFDVCRVDHLVGFYRTYFRPHDGTPPQFTPADEPSQIALGERVLEVLRESGPDVIAEDLGLVPDFVRFSLARLAVPGYKVFRWERDWDVDGQPFKDPADYPAVSVATSGTHDTEPMTTWWTALSIDDRAAALAVPSMQVRLTEVHRHALNAPGLSPVVRAALLEALYASRSETVIIPIQDIFGWSDRINVPATVSEANWTWRLPWPVDRLPVEAESAAVAAQLLAWCRSHSR